MTTKAEKEAEMLRAVLAYQRDTAKIAKSIARATIDAVNELKGDAEAIFSAFLVKGGLTREEAERIMSRPITETVRRRLIERAKRTYKDADLRKALVRLSSRSYRHRMDNAEALKVSARMNGDALHREVMERISPAVDRVTEEATARTNFHVQKEAGVAVDWSLPNKPQLKATQEEIGVYHKVKLFTAEELETARTRISEGILAGEQFDDIADKLAVDTGKEAYKTRRLVRTTMAQAASDAELKTLKDLGIERYEITCVLDEKTCPICGKYDGRIYRTDDPGAPRPTFHPNCRCSIHHVLDDDIADRMQRSARDENGRTIRVPKRMTYAQWREKYGPKDGPPEPRFKKQTDE